MQNTINCIALLLQSDAYNCDNYLYSVIKIVCKKQTYMM